MKNPIKCIVVLALSAFVGLFATSPAQAEVPDGAVAHACEVKTVPCVIEMTWVKQSTTKSDAEWVCLFKNLKLTEICGFEVTCYRAFGNYSFSNARLSAFDLTNLSGQTGEGFYHWSLAEDGLSATFQVQRKDHGYMGVEFVRLEQRETDVWGAVVGIKYPSGGPDFGVDATTSGQSNSCKYYYDDDAMNSEHAIMNFSLQDFTAYVMNAGKTFAVSFVDSEGVLETQNVTFGESATAPDNASVHVPDGCVFAGWDVDFSKVIDNMTVKAVYHQFFTVVFKDADGTVLDEQEVEETMSATAPDLTGKSYEGEPFVGWDIDFSNVTENLIVTALYAGDATYEGYVPSEETLLFPGYRLDTVKGIAGIARGSYGSNDPKEFQLDMSAADGPGVYLFTKSVNDGGETVVSAEFQFKADYMLGMRVELVGREDGIWGRVTDWKYMYNRSEANYGETIVGASDFGSEFYDYAYDKSSPGICKVALHDLTLIGAKLNVKMLTVSFEDVEGNVLLVDGAKTQRVETGKAVKAPTPPERAGYSFVGWDHDVDAVFADCVIRPVYHQILTVNYLKKDGSVLATFEKVEETTKLTEDQVPQAPAEEGFRFLGWNPDLTTTAVSATADAVFNVTPNYWKEHTVIFVDHDGTVLKTESVLDGSPATAPDLTGAKIGRRAFYAWDKWFNVVKSDLTVTAQYGVIADVPSAEGLAHEIGESEVYFKNMRLKKILGVKAQAYMKWGTNEKTADLISVLAPDASKSDLSGIYDFKKTDTEISFEVRTHADWGYGGEGYACKIVLRQSDDDVTGTVVWAKGGCEATEKMALASWDEVEQTSFLYHGNFGFNNMEKLYTLIIRSLFVMTDTYEAGMTLLIR